MKNKILAITRDSIPYVKELRAIPEIKSCATAILMQQLDYWFSKNKKDRFFKFLSPCEHPKYNEGDSWTEELGFSEDEFRTAFDSIGVRYKSMKEISEKQKAGEDIFQNMFYLSYTNRIEACTYYMRNNDLVDLILDSLMSGTLDTLYETVVTQVGKVKTRKQARPIYVNRESQDTETGNTKTDSIITENTAETTTEKETPTPFVQAEEINNNGAQSDKVKITPKRGGGAANFEELKEPFEAFRKYASKLGMTARGLDTEFDNFIKKFPKEAEMVIPKLLDCVKAFELEKTENGKRPIEPKYMPHVATWINQKRWESYMETEAQETDLLTKLLKMTYNEAGEYMKKMVDTKQIEREAAITIWKEYDQKRPKQFARYD